MQDTASAGIPDAPGASTYNGVPELHQDAPGSRAFHRVVATGPSAPTEQLTEVALLYRTEDVICVFS